MASNPALKMAAAILFTNSASLPIDQTPTASFCAARKRRAEILTQIARNPFSCPPAPYMLPPNLYEPLSNPRFRRQPTSRHNAASRPDMKRLYWKVMPSNPVILIPARMGSTRFPDKVLAEIAGAPMIVQVWRRAQEAALGRIVVAQRNRRLLRPSRRLVAKPSDRSRASVWL